MILLKLQDPPVDAVARGSEWLARDPGWAPALWIAKDLYSCPTVVEAAVLAAKHLAATAVPAGSPA